MMLAEASLRFSVIIASRGRPDHLRRTLSAVRQLDHPAFEVIVVGDAETLAVANAALSGCVRCVEFDHANLSEARNLGICRAAGDVCAFVDDDAIPEPLWLQHHAAALAGTGAAASVGFVRGPDGIRFQSRFQSIDRQAETHDETAEGDAPFLPKLPMGRVTKLVGTNMTVRRDILLELGGFDPGYRYFLEDGDLSLRLRAGDHLAAVVPLAEVHHALAASPSRTRLRVPRSLFEIGRSAAVFLRRHSDARAPEARDRLIQRERTRLLRGMVRGVLEPRDVARLERSLEDGWEEGLRKELAKLRPLCTSGDDFEPLPVLKPGHKVVSCRRLRRASGLKTAEDIVSVGNARASVFCFSLTGLPHSVRYTDQGYWLHTGGQFVETESAGKRFRWCRFANRVEEETRRVAKRRGLDESDRVTKAAASRL